MERVVITRPFWGICHMGVCAAKDATDEEILAVCNGENPSGTSAGWCNVIRDDKEYPQCNPVKCSDAPERLHFMVSC